MCATVTATTKDRSDRSEVTFPFGPALPLAMEGFRRRRQRSRHLQSAGSPAGYKVLSTQMDSILADPSLKASAEIQDFFFLICCF